MTAADIERLLQLEAAVIVRCDPGAATTDEIAAMGAAVDRMLIVDTDIAIAPLDMDAA